MFRRLCLIPLLLISCHVGAVEIQKVRSEQECKRLHPDIRSPVEYTTCIVDAEGAEAQLGKAYNELLDASDKRAEPLKSAQAAWLVFRDSQCRYEAEGIPGAGGTSVKIACTARMNRQRAIELDNYLDN